MTIQQPNFTQISNGLTLAGDSAHAADAPPGLRAYAPALAAMRARFAEAERRTDASYTAWRVAVGDELRALRLARVLVGRISASCDEHGYDDIPGGTLVYTERDELLRRVAELGTYLDGRRAEWDWVGRACSDLAEHRDRVLAAQQAAADALARYQVDVQERVAAYASARALLREVVVDAANDVGAEILEPVRRCAGL
jgi:hypothetical protein